MKLLDAPKGSLLRVIDYRGGKGVEFKLRQLGLAPGHNIKILRYAPLGGPVMIDVEADPLPLAEESPPGSMLRFPDADCTNRSTQLWEEYAFQPGCGL